jgi:hypothetical protein
MQGGPIATLFGQPIAGEASLVKLHLDSQMLQPTLIVEWVAQAGKRIWILRISQEQPTDVSTLTQAAQALTALHGITLTSTTLNQPSTLKQSTHPVQHRASSIGQPHSSANLPYPSWWNGYCDTNNYYNATGIYAYQLGTTTYLGMPACGPRPAFDGGPDVTVYFFPGAWGVLEWECVELSMHYLYLAYNIAPYPANGSQVVWNYSGTLLQKISNGTIGQAPQPGDVLSYGSTSTAGHTSVVIASNVDSNGNGSITVLEENGDPNGVPPAIPVSNWVVNPGWTTVSGWLHGPSTSGGPQLWITPASWTSLLLVATGPCIPITSNQEDQTAGMAGRRSPLVSMVVPLPVHPLPPSNLTELWTSLPSVTMEQCMLIGNKQEDQMAGTAGKRSVLRSLGVTSEVQSSTNEEGCNKSAEPFNLLRRYG